MTGNEAPQYVVYLRKSKGRAGISRQRTITGAHIARLGGTVLREFKDTDRTAYQRVGGTRPVREDFDQMLGFLASHPGARVAAWHADRLLRNSADTEALIERCAQGGHLVETPAGGSYDLSTASGRKRIRNDAVDAAYEVDHLTERVTEQKLEAASLGLWLGGPIPFGWRKDKGSGEMELHPAESGAVRQATLDMLSHASLHSIARQWNAAGLTTSRGHNKFTPQEVRAVLLRARNAGLHVHKGEMTGVRGNWPRIVTEDQWRACRAVLTDPARRSSPGNERRWLGSGLYRCGTCGQGMIVTAVGGKGRPVRKVYRCTRRTHVARDAASLDEFVGTVIVAWLSRKDAAPALRRAAPDVTALTDELAAVRAELAELPRLKNAGKLRLSDVVEMAGPLREREAAIEARIARIGQPSPLDAFRAGDPSTVWDGLDLSRRRAVLAFLMTVTVCPAPKGRPRGWRPGEPYFDTDSVLIGWHELAAEERQDAPAG